MLRILWIGEYDILDEMQESWKLLHAYIQILELEMRRMDAHMT